MDFCNYRDSSTESYELSLKRIYESLSPKASRIIDNEDTPSPKSERYEFRNSFKERISEKGYKEFILKLKQRALVRNNFQLRENPSYGIFNEYPKDLASKVIASFYQHLNPDKYIWDKMDIDLEEDFCIKFESKTIEVSISIEDISEEPDFDMLDSYLSIFRNGKRISYNRPLKSLIGILNDMQI